MGETSDSVLEEGSAVKSTGNGRLAWFDRKVKAKFTLLSIVLVTAAYYIVLFFHLELDYFTYYAGFIALLLGGYTGADVANTRAFLKAKGGNSTDG